MEILRVPPYADIPITFTVPSSVVDEDVTVIVTDMADLSISTLEFDELSTGDTVTISLPGQYDSDYRVEIIISEETVSDNTYEVIRPYVNPDSMGSTASEVSAYADSEELARAIIDSIVGEGFYYRKKVLNFPGTGSDYLPIWDDVKKVLSVYENKMRRSDHWPRRGCARKHLSIRRATSSRRCCYLPGQLRPRSVCRRRQMQRLIRPRDSPHLERSGWHDRVRWSRRPARCGGEPGIGALQRYFLD